MIKLVKIILICLLLIQSVKAFAWNDKMHQKITATAIVKAVKFDYFKNNTGLRYLFLNSNDTRDIPSIMPSFMWTIAGSRWEDNGLYHDTCFSLTDHNCFRYLFHFYDPINKTGLNFTGFTFTPAPVWAKSGPGIETQLTINLWSLNNIWSLTGDTTTTNNARTYLYNAMTSTLPSDRSMYFANTFRSIGQIAHVLEDMSQPSHTRNDPHANYDGTWQTNVGETYIGPSVIEAYGEVIYPFVNMAPNPWIDNNIDVTVTDFDKQYSDLATISNMNFFSDRTILTYYSHPAQNETNLNDILSSLSFMTVLDKNGFTKNRIYLKETSGQFTDTKLAAVGYYAGTQGNYPGLQFILKPLMQFSPHDYFRFDNMIADNNIRQLSPYAVKYTAELLDYFFRDNIELTLPDSGVYSVTSNITGSNNQPPSFQTIKILAKNKSGTELSSGTIKLVVQYKQSPDRYPTFPFRPPQYAYGFEKYFVDDNLYTVVDEQNITSIPISAPVLLTFDLGNNPIPVNATDLRFTVVYRGRYGDETDSVQFGFKDTSEATPFDLFNNMDKICINGQWYNAGSPDAITIGQANNFDAYAHDLKGIYVRFMPVDKTIYASAQNYLAYIPLLQAGNFIRAFYILTDPPDEAYVKDAAGNEYPTGFTFTNKYKFSTFETDVKTDKLDPWSHSPTATLYNAYAFASQDGWYIGIYNFRGIGMEANDALVYINYPYPSTSACQYSELAGAIAADPSTVEINYP